MEREVQSWKDASRKSYSLLVLFATFLVLYEDSIMEVFLLFCLAVNENEFSILLRLPVDVELRDDAGIVESDVIVDIVDIEGMRFGGGDDDNCGKIDECFFYHDSADNIDFEHLFKNILVYLSVDIFVFFLRIILIT